MKHYLEKLNDTLLDNVSGGVSASSVAKTLAGLTVLPSLGCGIASCVYLAKANRARRDGDVDDYEKYINKAQNCGIASTALIGIGHCIKVVTNFANISNKSK